MPEYTYKTTDLEVLVATMHRTSLDFLYRMFEESGLQDFKILVINQTNEKTILESDNPNIRVINSFETGLSKSRNLAIHKAYGKICLIADDDVVFAEGFSETILNAFTKKPEAGIITFKVQTPSGDGYRNYPAKSQKHTSKTLKRVMSIEIAMNAEIMKDNEVFFEERFGLGSEFPTAEEYLFAREVFQKTGEAYFVDAFIVSHNSENSGQLLGSPKIVAARAALKYKLYGYMGYIWLIKYIFFLIRKKYIASNDFYTTWKEGIKGINKYKAGKQ